MSVPASLRFMNCRRIGQPDCLVELLDLLLAVGIRPMFLEVGSLAFEQFAFWREYTTETKRELYIAHEKQQLTFRTADDHSHIVLTFKVTWSSDGIGRIVRPMLQASASTTTMFTQRQWEPERHAQRYLAIGKWLYDLLQPALGWIERCRPRGYTSCGDVENHMITHLYWANFFGPAYVDDYGRDFLLSAPGWEVESLGDGGVLHVLSPSLAGTGPRPVIEEVKRYFKVDSVRRVN